MMELKEYQNDTLDAFDRWRRKLDEAREESQRQTAALVEAGASVPAEIGNFPKTAWGRLADDDGVADSAGPYVDREDGAGRPIPHVCFKIPTGGGKTLLGAAALERLGRQTGLVLWIVPSRAIYAQTRAAFRSREHPCRQTLERASGGRVKILEKDERFTAGDVANRLCVMLLMLPAANRNRNRDFLRMFRDSGRYPTLFPDSDDVRRNAELLERCPDLATGDGGMVRHSLFNAMKMLRPVVVLDEAHKAYGGKGADEFVRGRQPPQTPAGGRALGHAQPAREQPARRRFRRRSEEGGDDQAAGRGVVAGQRGLEGHARPRHDKLDDLAREAASLEGSEGRYVRPIAVVRVERTGRDQRDAGRIHAEDARDHLIELGVPPDAVRVKSAENDEIAGEDLMSGRSPVRWIITKAALMEGWDCPFAYVLVMLDATRSERALTQLMGRVMRQPHARRTGRDALDRCYVFCWQTAVDTALRQVKNGLENEGLTGLADDVIGRGAVQTRRVTVRRRERFRDRDLFLPKVLHRDLRGGWRDLDFQRHILSAIKWGEIEAPTQPELEGISGGPSVTTASYDLDAAPAGIRSEALDVDAAPTIEWFTRQLTDLVPNPWQAARIAGDLLDELRARGFKDARIYAQRRAQVFNLREHIQDQIGRQAERVFQEKLEGGAIRFNLEPSEPNFRVADEYERDIATDDHSLEYAGQGVQKSLFDPPLEREFNTLEKDFAFHIDREDAIQWWHRIIERQRHEYYLRGWQQDRIYPDFVAMSEEPDGTQRLLVVDTKGRHLEGNQRTRDTEQVFAPAREVARPGRHVRVRHGERAWRALSARVRQGALRRSAGLGRAAPQPLLLPRRRQQEGDDLAPVAAHVVLPRQRRRRAHAHHRHSPALMAEKLKKSRSQGVYTVSTSMAPSAAASSSVSTGRVRLRKDAALEAKHLDDEADAGEADDQRHQRARFLHALPEEPLHGELHDHGHGPRATPGGRAKRSTLCR